MTTATQTGWAGRNGWYELPARDGERWLINNIGRRWFITHPGERTPDAERPTLREARAYVDRIVADEHAEHDAARATA